MKVSTRNRAAGASNIAKGRAKRVTGSAVRSARLRTKGRAQEAVGRIQKSIRHRQKARGE